MNFFFFPSKGIVGKARDVKIPARGFKWCFTMYLQAMVVRKTESRKLRATSLAVICVPAIIN